MSSASSRSSADPVSLAIDAGTARLVAAVRAIDALNPVVLVDGRSGAGKSSLAKRLVAAWPLRGRVQLIALDSLYPGWDGLDAGVATALDDILRPHARGLVGVWQRWDWDAEAHAEAHAVDPSLPLIVEGAGILTPRTARVADIAVWVDAPTESRRRRALTRDGDTYRPHWERWAAQEDAHISRDRPQELASITVPVP